MTEKTDVPAMFARYVFTEEKMEKYVSPVAISDYRRCLETGTSLSMETANAIAEGMKTWAIENGVTHYTHWFQPLNGGTAQKYESFMEVAGKGHVIMEFSGKELVKGEPDASSFPSGGLRATFEARGYSAWDPTSCAFIDNASLCIPTVFFSYSGEALDKKTPLLRSIKVLGREALRILRILGDDKTSSVVPMVGAEQEYFLIDKDVFSMREDLKICGRTLFGAKPPKTQELDDHYFGSIRPRVAAFMEDLETQLWKLGIPAKTKHNEVAPSQHEMAPIYTDCNTANDQNQLTMNIMRRIADRHNLVCLLAEKPFEGVNGSGKHNNWSLATDRGENLYSPGKTPAQNARFLLFLAAFISAVDDYQELIRCSVAYAGNDHRLGGNEAPPAIISIFLGTELQEIIDSIVNGVAYAGFEVKPIRIGLDTMPLIPRDTSDRNRTSPIAFTGNKFEFRMPGSSQSIAGPNTVFNTIVAGKLRDYADRLQSVPSQELNSTLHDLIREEFISHSRIIFNGNGYDEAWVLEAERRGLANLRNTAQAIPVYLSPKNVALMERMGVMSEAEMAARNEIHIEKYRTVVSIEAGTLVSMVRREIIPAISAFESKMLGTILDRRKVFGSSAVSSDEPERSLSIRLAYDNRTLDSLCTGVEEFLAMESESRDYEAMIGLMEQMRNCINDAGALIPSGFWPYPTYNTLLFSV